MDDQGQTVLSLQKAKAQYEAKLANLIPGASADNDYTPGGPTGEAEAKANMNGSANKPVGQDGGADDPSHR